MKQRVGPAPPQPMIPAARPTFLPLFPAQIWCTFLRMHLLQTLLSGQSVTFRGDSGHGGASQSGLEYSVRLWSLKEAVNRESRAANVFRKKCN